MAAGDGEDCEKIICFQLQEQELGIPISLVKETIDPPWITRLPLCPDLIAGLINLRGDVVAVLDLRRMLDLGPEGAQRQARRRIILLRGAVRGTTGHGALCGLLVDRVTAARKLPLDAVRPPPKTMNEATAACLRGVATVRDDERRDGESDSPGRPVLLLDVQRILATERLDPFRGRQ